MFNLPETDGNKNKYSPKKDSLIVLLRMHFINISLKYSVTDETEYK